jgi:hypothetical protein
MRQAFYRILGGSIALTGGVLVSLPLILVGLLFFWEWLATGHWVRATLCPVSYALGVSRFSTCETELAA